MQSKGLPISKVPTTCRPDAGSTSSISHSLSDPPLHGPYLVASAAAPVIAPEYRQKDMVEERMSGTLGRMCEVGPLLRQIHGYFARKAKERYHEFR